jgi:hypothetical protein
MRACSTLAKNYMGKIKYPKLPNVKFSFFPVTRTKKTDELSMGEHMK